MTKILTTEQVDARNEFTAFKIDLLNNGGLDFSDATGITGNEFIRLAQQRFEIKYPHHSAVLKAFHADLSNSLTKPTDAIPSYRQAKNVVDKTNASKPEREHPYNNNYLDGLDSDKLMMVIIVFGMLIGFIALLVVVINVLNRGN